MLTGKNTSRKSRSREIISSSETQGNFVSLRSAGNTLPNVPKPAFTPSQHLTFHVPTEVPARVTRQETGRDTCVDMCSGHNQETLADQVKREHLLLEDRAAEAPMPPAAGNRLAMLKGPVVSYVEGSDEESRRGRITEILSEGVHAYLRHKGSVRKQPPLRGKEN